MQRYGIRRGHAGALEGEGLAAILRDCFGSCAEQGDELIAEFGALRRLSVRRPDKNTLEVETTMDPGVSDEVARETIRAFNTFLERATGYKAKQRSQRVQKQAKERAL